MEKRDMKKLQELYRQTGKKELHLWLIAYQIMFYKRMSAEDHRPFMNYIVAACNALPELLNEIEWYEHNKTQLEQQVDELIDENDRLRTEIWKEMSR